VLGAVAALGEVLVTSDVATLARVTSLARLGMARGRVSRVGFKRDNGLRPTSVGEDRHRDRPLRQSSKVELVNERIKYISRPGKVVNEEERR
jgi:hypothetical protein